MDYSRTSTTVKPRAQKRAVRRLRKTEKSGSVTAKMDKGGRQRGSRWRIAVWGTAAFLLLLPVVVMQFTNKVNSNPLTGSLLARSVKASIVVSAYRATVRLSRHDPR